MKGNEWLDNFRIENIRYILNEDTTLSRFYPLIPQKEKVISSLEKAGVTDKYKCLLLSSDDIIKITGMTEHETALLASLLHLHDFKDRKLSDIPDIPADFYNALVSDGIQKSSSYLSLCKRDGIQAVSRKYNTNEAEAFRLVCFFDLMRLPGVRTVRASLYYNCGYKRTGDFFGLCADEAIEKIRKIIEKNNMACIAPQKKELSTQIAAAILLPELPF